MLIPFISLGPHIAMASAGLPTLLLPRYDENHRGKLISTGIEVRKIVFVV